MIKATAWCVVLAACGYADPGVPADGRAADGASRIDAAAVDAAPIDAEPACATCLFAAVEPSIATAGDTIVLEGTFVAPTVATFPGGGVATASLLGSHRAVVVVPAGAGVGEISVHSGASAIGQRPFTSTDFKIGLQPFATSPTKLGAPVAFASSLVTPDFVYTLCDNGPTAQRAVIHTDGSLAAFATDPSVTCATPRSFMSTAAAGRDVYLVGGLGSAGELGSVDRGTVDATGTLGAITLEPAATLIQPRHGHVVAVIGDLIYVFGGSTSTTTEAFTPSVEAAQIQLDGSLGPFSTQPNALLEKVSGAAVVVTSGYVYLLGGQLSPGQDSAIADIERAPIHGDGSLGAFESAGALTTARLSASVVIAGRTVYVISGGTGSGATGTVEAATIAADGSLGAFAVVTDVTLPVPMQSGQIQVVGSSVVLLGGQISGSVTDAVQLSSLNAGAL